ncbi:MAG: DUF4349 domain-containing protein [Chthoniobacterales bacterium]
MATTHDLHNDIESWLAAAVHDQLSTEERAQFNEHLASCTNCRALYEEELTMSRMIESTLDEAKPDLAFEQRIVSGFRKTVPQRTGFVPLLVSLFRLRATQITAVAAVLLTLVQVGRMVTGESAAPRSRGEVAQISSFKDSRMHPDVSEAQSAPPPPVAAKAVAPQPQSYATADTASAASGLRRDNALAAKKAETRAAKTQAAAAEPAQDAQAPEFVEEKAEAAPTSADVNRKLVRNAQVELEVIKFDDAVQKITAFAGEDKGYVATSSSERQANGKLRGEVVVKVLPDHLDGFLLKLRGLGDVKNQTLGTEDVTKQYFDTDARLKNARVMEQRLVDILKTKSTKVADLLEVEKELGRVREQIETMQGELKYMEVQVAFATVTITLAEKEMNVPAAFLLKRRATLALFSTDVEKTFGEVKGVIDGAKAQISSSTLDRDSSGEATARLTLLIVPEEADTLIDRIKGMGRVQNYNEQTDRIAQGGTGMGENAKVERDKVQLSITISRNEQEPALQSTSLRILTSSVGDKVARLKENAAKSGAEIRSSSFTRNPDGQEVGNLTLRVAMKNYAALMSSFDQLGKVKDVSVQRDDRRGAINEETAPADISIQIYSQPNIVADETGLFATIRRTLAQGASALMWSLRMIGVALAFFAPWIVALVIVIWVAKRISRARAARRAQRDAAE